ncbi:hypothetical protein P3X46_015108 [Hevea brasiliensis]|uniref:RING-type E3 ubiquitin transferase n=1 Tax=Hevea brasiliensis TaxID=3981 RepID=A0ABQ9LUU7_HEVBR|nr:RING-H2 finger protein ATL5-like isoform X1 [Hevea brasiliensis]KAJ9171794.1 hypothetical protein P3X46_015108 [Hevea brasiliensis]
MENTDGISNQVSNNTAYARNGKIMLCSGIILFTIVVFIVCFHSYARWIFKHRQRRRHLLSLSVTPTAAGAADKVLDPSILGTLPTFVYSSKTQDSVLQCAVCLSEFQEGEKGRVLPKCSHTFHVCCLDIWFHAHSNCPLCRAPVQSDKVPETVAETVVPVIEEAGLQPESRQKKEDERACSASSSPASLCPLECQRKSSCGATHSHG